MRTELGSGTTIVSANKVRSGGVAGFFARETYEVIVEHDGIVAVSPSVADDPTKSIRPRDIAAPTLMELVEQVSSEERAAAPRIATEADEPAAPRISTESEPFAAVMERMAFNAGVPDAAPAVADDEPAFVAEAEIVDEIPVPAPAPVVQAPAPAPSPAAQAPAPLPTPAPVPAVAPSAPPVMLGEPRGHVGALVKMGLPSSFVPAVPSSAALEAALRSSLTRLPEAPAMPKSTGSVVAIVGERNAALDVARELSSQAGLDPDAISVASRRRLPARTPEHLIISGSDDAAEKRRSWRRRDRPSVVVIDSELGRDKQAWAYHVLAALEPSATWGVVEATRKTEDVAAWVNGLGGVDALAVNDVDATSSPAAVLQLEIPVGRIDGRPASPALWAALLTERLAA